MRLIVNEKENKLVVKELDGRLCNDVLKLDSSIGKLFLKLAERRNYTPEQEV